MSDKPTFTFTIETDGSATLRIEGLAGREACAPIHDALSKDLASIVKIAEYSAEDTPEAREQPPTYTTVGYNTARW